MSAARILARNLYDLGRRARRFEFDDWSIDGQTSHNAMQTLRQLGLVSNAGAIGTHAAWELTPAGREWVVGRLTLVCGRHPTDRARNASASRRKPSARMPRQQRLARTWVGSLPQGVRINSSETRETA